MKVLLIHADNFEYEVKSKAIKEPEKINSQKGSMDEVLVTFCTVESSDEDDPVYIVKKTVTTIEDIAQLVKTNNIVVYPYAHLSSQLASNNVALSILSQIGEDLKIKKYNIIRAPFGWYKSFKLKCKGHPLAELSRSIVKTEDEKSFESEKIEREFLILDQNGREHKLVESKIDDLKILNQYASLKNFILSEIIGMPCRESPPHIRLMKKFELIDYEPASDIGHFRFYPKGTLIKKLLEEFATELAVKKLNSMNIETPFIYRLDQSDILGQATRFGEKDYRFDIEGRKLILRFAGDFGLFRMMKDVTMNYRQLPIRIFELSSSFRLEQRGECVGLKRLRAFTMPDIHCFCKDLEQGMHEYSELYKNYKEVAESMQIDYAIVFRVVKDFYEENKDWFVELIKASNMPALLELLPKRKHYWIVKNEFQALDSVGGNLQLCTVQLDVEDSERYGIKYIDFDNKEKGCIIVHSSMGSLERWICAILEMAEKKKNSGGIPMLPVWLSPTQVRILPVSQEFITYAEKMSVYLEENGMRVDIDDREQSLAKRIREAEIEWIPFIIVLGKEEIDNDSLSVRIREQRKSVVLKPSDLLKIFSVEVKDKPKLPLNMPRRLSMRPKFI